MFLVGSLITLKSFLRFADTLLRQVYHYDK
jgi:hypothetical protein